MQLFNIDKKKKCFLNYQISLLEWCWKFSCVIKGINTNFKYIKIDTKIENFIISQNSTGPDMKWFVGIIGVITYNLTSANNHKRQEKSRTASFSLDYSFETLKNCYKELSSFMKSVESLSVCVVSSFRAGRSHHYIPKDTSVFGTEGNISCNKVNIWSQLCVCVSTWMITLEALVQWVGWNGWTHPVHLRLGLTDGGLDQSQKCSWRVHDPESTGIVPLWGFSWVCFATHNLGCGN